MIARTGERFNRRLRDTAGIITLMFAAGIASAQVPMGTIVGIVKDPAKLPVGGATIIAAKEGGGIRSTISSSDGCIHSPILRRNIYGKGANAGYPMA